MAGKQGEGRLLQHGRRGEERGRDGGEIEEIRERESSCASADAVFLKIRKSCHPALLFFVFFSGQVIGSLTPKNHFQ